MTTRYNAKFDTLYYDSRASINEPCEVIVADNELTVSYYDEDLESYAVYKGKEIAPGHFDLVAPMVNGRATLHRFPGADILVGEWMEGGYRGMWRIELD